MPEAAPVTSAVLPSRSLMLSRSSKKVSPRRYRAKRLPKSFVQPLSGETLAKKFRPDATGRNACTWIAAGSPAHFGKENAALRLGGRLRFHDFHHHRFSRNGEILHHRIGDVLDQRALLIERAALDGVDVDFRHIGLPFCASHRGTIAAAPNIGRRLRSRGLTGRSRKRPRARIRHGHSRARHNPRSPVVRAYLAPPNGIAPPGSRRRCWLRAVFRGFLDAAAGNAASAPHTRCGTAFNPHVQKAPC